ncbi:calcium-dependent phosphotriesterase [Plenodomus tracheiphilus IPT5]|uniref:Calcium-dependent phosphotriesterase n=1 Tax=Plenodomus tracheiphilus IPT5 TaxID=1408161 RepID=A0A6A7B5F4_9PLEO|nr:calcium-dependent phosphotriesterase [Plenodomus tracheiphilus IPT5]
MSSIGYTYAFKPYHPSIASIFGPTPKLELLLENTTYPFAHEAGVFIPCQNALYITSNQFPHPETGEPHITISRLDLPPNLESTKTTCTELHAPDIPMANGAVNYKNGILFCAQGTLHRNGGLVYMPLDTPPTSIPHPQSCQLPSHTNTHTHTHTHTPQPQPLTQTLLTTYHTRPFNSPNDIVIHSSTGTILFTDPPYGHAQRIRPPPLLPPQIYAFNPTNNSIRVVADGLARPNGLCFAPGEETLYITDTSFIHGDGSTDFSRPSTIYAYTVLHSHGEVFLSQKRVFAMADVGVPDGIKCDGWGNVYAGCGDGVNVWSPGGVLLGKILVEGGVANFCFGRGGVLYCLNETRVWRVRLGEGVKGALLGL